MEKKNEENEHWVEGQTATGEIDNNEIHGRAIQQQEHNRGYWETLNNDPWLLFWIGMMLWTLIIRGFENQSAGSVISIAEFKRRFGQQESDGTYFIATPWQSALSGGGNAAAILGAWGSSYLADIFGTKPVLIAGCAINIASVGVEFATTSIGMFFGGKMMNFVAIGVFLNLCTAYVSDISPLAIRASVIGFCNLSQCIGPFISAIMSYYTSQWDNDWSWKALVCAQWGFAIIGFIGQLFMPESPVYLVRVNKDEEARKVLNRLYSKPTDAEGHLQRIKLTLEEAETQKRATYAECFRGTNLRRTMIAVLVFLAEPMSGLGFVQNYGSLMYQFLGIGDRESFLIQIGAQILSISGATLSFLIGDFYGRRPMFLGGCISLTILLLCMGIAGSVNTTAGITAAVGFYTMYNFVFNIGVGSNVYAIAGEVPTSALRTKTLAISLIVSNAVNTMWSFVAPYMFNPGYGDLKAKIGFVFGGFMLFFIAGAWYLVPETRMRTYEELDELFMNRVPTREFKKYVTVAERRAAEAYATERKLSAPEVEREV
ncbi:general substrate transporter [Penicillium malachiteum]|uniref:general substrate transporter n=1 Tax=Penicillium malachiteum TaxID=1324776 RepID=UPI002548CFCA|nr:general substrate transporter [Penicillium malachiteum]KAJ5713704.1 general substrate transporter [Penicillium malachiteum]